MGEVKSESCPEAHNVKEVHNVKDWPPTKEWKAISLPQYELEAGLWSKLPAEVIHIILDNYASVNYNCRSVVSRLSRHWYSIIRPRIWDRVWIDGEACVERLLRTFRRHDFAAEVLPPIDTIELVRCRNLIEVWSAFVAHGFRPKSMLLAAQNHMGHGPEVKISEFRSLERLLVTECEASSECSYPAWLEQARPASPVRCINLPRLKTFVTERPWGRICRNLASLSLVMPRLETLYIGIDPTCGLPHHHPAGPYGLRNMTWKKYATQVVEYISGTVNKVHQHPQLAKLGFLILQPFPSFVNRRSPSIKAEDCHEAAINGCANAVAMLEASVRTMESELRSRSILGPKRKLDICIALVQYPAYLEITDGSFALGRTFALRCYEKVLDKAFAARAKGATGIFTTDGLDFADLRSDYGTLGSRSAPGEKVDDLRCHVHTQATSYNPSKAAEGATDQAAATAASPMTDASGASSDLTGMPYASILAGLAETDAASAYAVQMAMGGLEDGLTDEEEDWDEDDYDDDEYYA